MQKKLSSEQVSAFYHTGFVFDQVSHFVKLVNTEELCGGKIIVDIGGGCGYFSHIILNKFGVSVRVVDMDPVSVQECNSSGVEAFCYDAVDVLPQGDESVVCFNLILHHLVSDTEFLTASLQKKALSVWKGKKVKIFINEYIYESYINNASGWLIYQITRSKMLSLFGKFVALFLPSLRANTFGVGVRFRSHNEWRDFFNEAGFNISNTVLGEEEYISLPRKLLLIKSIRRDSFLLESA